LHVYIRRRTYHWFPRAAFASLEDYRAVITIISARVSKFERLDFGRIALVAFGSNLGDSRKTVLRAIRQLREFSIRSPLVSSLWQTTPVDCPPGSPMFVNAVVGLQPRKDETPESLLEKLRALEKVFGRKPKNVLNEARPLDLDLVAFGNETRNTERLVLPHPRAHLRRFVMQPLNEIAPHLILPSQTKTVEELLAELPADPTMTKIN
jgi:2-amino-4-hydroxy-6-hydroxymethyldihydropteridine diphosphokinase